MRYSVSLPLQHSLSPEATIEKGLSFSTLILLFPVIQTQLGGGLVLCQPWQDLTISGWNKHRVSDPNSYFLWSSISANQDLTSPRGRGEFATGPRDRLFLFLIVLQSPLPKLLLACHKSYFHRDHKYRLCPAHDPFYGRVALKLDHC
jgi:hypothetical protein